MFLELYKNNWILNLVSSQHNRHMPSFLYVDLPSCWMKIPNKILTHPKDLSLESTSFQCCILDQCIIFRRLPLYWHWAKFEKCSANLCQAGSLQISLSRKYEKYKNVRKKVWWYKQGPEPLGCGPVSVYDPLGIGPHKLRDSTWSFISACTGSKLRVKPSPPTATDLRHVCQSMELERLTGDLENAYDKVHRFEWLNVLYEYEIQ